ncbi:MAG: leucine-rich repeat protein [Bacteroidaceae bacterium]|nr:leucine-rich repeat protein [Bacteroidaceae bacterium]
MKKHIFPLIGCIALLFVGCMNDLNDDLLPVEGDGAIAVELFNEINQVTVTRVNDEGFCNGDAVGIYVVNYKGEQPGTLLDKGNQADNVRYVLNESEGKWTPDYPVYYYDKVTPVDIIGFYPQVKIDKVNSYPFEVAKDQSTDASNGALGGYEASDFLWGKTEKVSPTSQRVNITFHHRMAGILVELTEGEGFDENEWAALEKQVLVGNTIRKATIDLATGNVSATGDVSTTGTVPAQVDESWRAVVVPQTIAAQVALFNITVDGVPYIFRKGEPFEYRAGKLHKFTIEVSKRQGTGVEFKLIGEAITAWESETITHDGEAREYVIINVPKAAIDGKSALKSAIEAAGKDYTKIKNLKVAGEINSQDFYFMRDEMTVLQSVNLKEVTVVADKSGRYANEIPYGAFQNKATLLRIIFPESITSIGAETFCGTNITGSLIIPNSVIEIRSMAFKLISSLNGTLTLSKNLRNIGTSAFMNCNNLRGELHLPNSLEVIEGGAFYECSGLTGELLLPTSLKQIGGSAFCGCSGLTGDLIIPDNIIECVSGAFRGCNFGGKLVLSKNMQVIGDGVFESCGFKGELEIPSTVTTIGSQAFKNNNFSGTLVLPNELASIGDRAFENCQLLSGKVVIPNGVRSIASTTFRNCRQLEGVVLHSQISSIGSGAFENCYQLNSIVCDAKTPPALDASAFNGVAKDNFVVEVPEASVIEYTLAPNWKEFKRIAAHRDFSISRNVIRTLNAGNSKTLILRTLSGEAWSVESCPDWVTVTPTSGVGKSEIKITVNEMSASESGTFDVEVYKNNSSATTTKTYNGRAGEVVFLLEGKDYRTRTKVEQYNYEYGDGDVITNQTATIGKGVNVVFMGDCFDAQDIAAGKYLNGINEAIEYFFAVEPYNSYRDYFNVYTVLGVSDDSGMGTVNTIREARFGSQYTLNEGVGINQELCFEYACKAPTVTKENICQTPIVLIENSADYAGVTHLWNDGSAVALCPMIVGEYPYDYRGVVQHEAGGHAFGKLGDEYIYHNAFITNCPILGCENLDAVVREAQSRGWYRNLSLTGNIYDVPWSHLIFDEKYQNTVDVYEGAYMHTRGCFRSEPNSCMNNNIPYFSAISRQEIVERIMKYAGLEFSYEEWKANDRGLVTDGVATRSEDIPNYVKSYRSYNRNVPKFMGEKPKLNF